MSSQNNIIKTYGAFIWHGFFLALTMSMLDLNTVFPALISRFTDSKIVFGSLYSIMLGAPLVFNLIFSHYLKTYSRKKKFLMLGIYMRSFSFLGMAVFTYFYGLKNPTIAIRSFFLWIFLFSVSAGFAGIAYADLIAKTVPSKKRTELYAVKQFVSSLAALGGGLIVSRIFSLKTLSYPANYSISLSIGFVGLFLSSLGFWILKEPESKEIPEEKEKFRDYLKKIPYYVKSDLSFQKYIIVENMASFSVMVLPFYMLFAKDIFQIDNSYIGRYLIFQISGTLLSNLVWGYLAKKFDSKQIVKTCIMLGGLIPLVAIATSFLGADYFSIVFFLLGFIISGRKIGFEPYLLDIAPEKHRTEYLGIRGTLNIFVVILPILGGFFINTLGYFLTFGLVSIIMLLASMLLTTPKSS